MMQLDPSVKQEVSYCIPLWLRDEQIKLACERPIPRIRPTEGHRDEPIALVCFGPTLNETWEKVRDFKYVMTCSGAHKFLVERGIVPNWHVEVDPRPHKVDLLGAPVDGCTYLPSSTCHPSYFDHLLSWGAKLELWHVFDSALDGLRTLPRGEWALTGGCSVGLRTMTIARFFGFREQHIFGMDGCARGNESHTTLHPMAPKKFQPCEYEGKTYFTTPAMLETARQTFHELDMMPDVKPTFYGEGLVREMFKHYVPNPAAEGKQIIGFEKPELISASYRNLNTQLHRDNLGYGVGGGRHAPTVMQLAKSISTTSVLDYGAGKGYLAKAIPYPIWEYDPAIPGKDEPPRSADLVVCLDVLEHVEPEKIFYVLDDLRRCCLKLGYFIIHTGPSSKFLADGRNAHVLQRGRNWWMRKLSQHFSVAKIIETGPLLHVIVAPLKTKQKTAGRIAQAAMGGPP